MEIITLASAALSLATPFLKKIGDGTAQKIGEEIWNLIKMPFNKRNENLHLDDLDSVKKKLIAELESNNDYRAVLEEHITNIQSQQNNNVQNINNHAGIEKQINVGSNNGPINM